MKPKKPVDPLSGKEAMGRALDMLSRRWRTAKQIEDKLRERGYDPDVIGQVLDKLRQWDYVDDGRYAESFVRERIAKGDGAPRSIRRRMRHSGIDPETAQEALEALDEQTQAALADSLAEKLWRRYEDREPRRRRDTVSQAMARRGYDWDVIAASIRKLEDAPEDGDEAL